MKGGYRGREDTSARPTNELKSPQPLIGFRITEEKGCNGTPVYCLAIGILMLLLTTCYFCPNEKRPYILVQILATTHTSSLTHTHTHTTTSKDPVKMLEETGTKVSISTVKRVLYRHNLKGRSARKKPLLQNRHKKARLRFTTAHGDNNHTFFRNILGLMKQK
ncbi:unnamed protein product [Oncorhynchus mykiss]|uniref:Transposase Tc1-like domain-containing protein n=1 Tax=Oncorhynchus mykiss TaxID=8022 RepID=A0A060X9K0_ONCMY|nr:unnamed protein product [Oncorhynchus mykiss]